MSTGKPSSEHLERILRLLALLLASSRPRTGDEIFEALAHDYTGTPEARIRKLHRDRDALRSLGIEIRYEENGGGSGGYRLDRDAFYLADAGFTPDEIAALCAIGSAAADRAFPMRGEIQSAVAKLLATGRRKRTSPVVALPGTPLDSKLSRRAELIARAARERRRLRLRYAGKTEERLVEPWVFTARQGRFALVGYCHLRKGVRAFYVDRMTSCELESKTGAGPQFDVPHDFDPSDHLPRHPWQLRLHEPMEVTLSFSGELAETGPYALGIEGNRCVTTNIDGLISEVLALGSGVTIEGPSQARQRLRERLLSMRESLRNRATPSAGATTPDPLSGEKARSEEGR